ncbi:MBL fold metallo-hydrolase [Clostridium bornimense]|uniref:MBL fold metallo-hydrolase n=1 Tax=Clostridium bornimense TaxID=1216932 RepID=UPI001C10BD96|nr:MBL fold metallo-hydrolase [Clostridium bornimense]MBU5316566.1 MBL fold metallo-hydrolase [Clostridium bornimense]
MIIEYIDKSTFVIKTSLGTKILTSPTKEIYNDIFKNSSIDIVTFNNTYSEYDDYKFINSTFPPIYHCGEYSFRDVKIKGFSSFQDTYKGHLRGDNIIFSYYFDNINITHLGHLGHIPSKEQLSALGNIDILLIPIGDNFTISGKTAFEILKLINPKVSIPMLYKSPSSPYLDSIDKFLIYIDSCNKINNTTIEINESSFPNENVILLKSLL